MFKSYTPGAVSAPAVYVVTYDVDWEGATVLGVAATLEDAKVLAEGHLSDFRATDIGTWEQVDDDMTVLTFSVLDQLTVTRTEVLS